MLSFMQANLPTLVVGAVVLAILALAVRKVVLDRKNHRSSCGCGCAGCPSSGSCHGG